MAKVFVFYQYLFPDRNVSSVHLSELCSGLAAAGWDVTGFPGNRDLQNPALRYEAQAEWNGVKLRRLWRPGFSRSSALGRIAGAVWMIAAWSLLSLRRNAPDIVVVGTDPIFSILVAPIWRLLSPGTLVVHWCFDLYPDAAYADGMIRPGSLIASLLEWLMTRSYAYCALVVDLGSCMRERIARYGYRGPVATLVPWALSEPEAPSVPNEQERRAIFGSSRLGLMYSGSFGRAHSFEDILALMKELEQSSAHFAFSVQGQREKSLRAAAFSASNVTFVPFAAKEKLEARLSCADVHVVSLRDEWTGMVIPSKFFGALAAGRPVLFCGSAGSSLARWIREYGLGWVLEPGCAAEVAAELQSFQSDAAAMLEMRQHCFDVYREKFSRQVTLQGWHAALSQLLQDQSESAPGGTMSAKGDCLTSSR